LNVYRKCSPVFIILKLLVNGDVGLDEELLDLVDWDFGLQGCDVSHVVEKTTFV